jgi:hypothetical protein
MQQQLEIWAAIINLNLSFGNIRLGYVRLPVSRASAHGGCRIALRKSGFDGWGFSRHPDCDTLLEALPRKCRSAIYSTDHVIRPDATRPFGALIKAKQ